MFGCITVAKPDRNDHVPSPAPEPPAILTGFGEEVKHQQSDQTEMKCSAEI